MPTLSRANRTPETHTARILSVLEIIAANPGIRLTSVASESSLPKGTVHRMVAELERLGWVSRAVSGAGLHAGHAFLGTALHVLEARFAHTTYIGILRNLAEDIGETCTVGVADGDEVVFFETVQPKEKHLAFVFPLAQRAPLYCSSTGRIFLAELPDEALDRYLAHTRRERFTEHTVVDERTLRSTIHEVRANGYAWTHNQWAMHVTGAAVAIRNERGKVLAALTFTAPESRVPVNDIASYLPRLREAANLLADELQHTVKPLSSVGDT